MFTFIDRVRGQKAFCNEAVTLGRKVKGKIHFAEKPIDILKKYISCLFKSTTQLLVL